MAATQPMSIPATVQTDPLPASPIEPPVFLLPRAIPKDDAQRVRKVTRAESVVAAALKDFDSEFGWPPLIAEALSRLTPKQRQYAIRTGSGMTDIQAYKLAYDLNPDQPDREHYGNINALNKNTSVASAQLMIATWMDQKWLLDSAEVKEYVSSVLYEQTIAGDTSSAKIKAAETLLRMHGLLIDKREVVHRDSSELDEQAAIFKSILADVSLLNVVDANYVQLNQHVEEPSPGYVCSACNLRANHEFADGDGI